MELYIIRHGQSANNALSNPEDRECDPPLTVMGNKQAAALAEYFKDAARNKTEIRTNEIDALYCSPMYRALQTAKPIGEALNTAPRVWIDIHEQGGVYLDNNNGEPRGLPGKTKTEILDEFPHYILPEGFTDNGWWHGDREDTASSHARAIRVALELKIKAAGREKIVILSHGGFISILIKALFNSLPDGNVHYHHMNTAVTQITLTEDSHTHIRYMNRIDHLSGNLIT